MDEESGRKRWFDEEADEVGGAVWAMVQFLRQEQSYQYDAYLHFLRLYSNRAVAALQGQHFTRAIDLGEKIRLNVIQACIDTSVAQIAANKSRPLHSPIGSSTEIRAKVKKLDQYILGVFHAEEHYLKSLAVFRDGGVFGTGFEKFVPDGDNVRIERVPPTEILVDDVDARLGDPKCLYHFKDVDRDTLMEDYCDGDEEKASMVLHSGLMNDQVDDHTNDKVTVVEAWYVGKEGRHVIAVQQGALLDEEWSDPFPFNIWRWNTLPFGYLGMGLAEVLSPIQVEINYIAQKIQRLMTLNAPQVWIQEGSGVTNITNEEFAQRKYRGRPPIFQAAASVSGEYFSHLDRLHNRAFEMSGISQLQAASVKPAGLESGEALKLYHDIGSLRFKHTSQMWEHYHVTAGERILECSRRILKSGGSPRAISVGGEVVEDLDFSDLEIGGNKYSVQVYPAALLPEEPAGRLDGMTKLAQTDPSSADMLWSLLDGVPDVQHIVKLKTAPRRMVEMMIDNMLETGRPETPTPMMDLQLARQLATQAWMSAKIEKQDDRKVDALRLFVAKIDALVQMQQQQMMQQQAAMQPPQAPQGDMNGSQSPAVPQLG